MSGNTTTIEKDKLVYATDDVRENKWRTIKSVDDDTLKIAGETLTLCSQGVIAAASGNYSALDDMTDQVDLNIEKMSTNKNKRHILLTELGY